MYRRATTLRLSTPASYNYNSTCLLVLRSARSAFNHRPRHLSTPLQPPDSRRETQDTPFRSEDAEITKQPHTPIPREETKSDDGTESRAGLGTEQLNEVKTRLQEWSHVTLKEMRERGDDFTARVMRRFAQLGSELNRVTGYDEIEVLKRKVVEQEAKIYNAREAARRAKDAYDTAVLQRAKSQREVNDLLQRKSQWTDEDVSRFTTLVREDHAREHDEGRAKAEAAAAEDAVEREFSELMRVILNRYHEEQAWSDKIRSASTYGQLAVLALNLVVFVLAIALVEPWKRRRLAQTFERKVEEITVQTAAAVGSSTDALNARMDEHEKVLRAMLDMVHLATHESPSEITALEREDAVATFVQQEGEREPKGEKQELLIVMTASAAVAGLVGWLARSWFG